MEHYDLEVCGLKRELPLLNCRMEQRMQVLW